jgi:rhamnose transport system permease protein
MNAGKGYVRPRGVISLIGGFRQLGIVVVILAIVAVVSFRAPAFLSVENFTDILLDIAIIVIVAIGQMMVIVTRGIDLSVGSIIGLVAMIVGMIIRDRGSFPMLTTIPLGIGLGVVLGAANGVIVTRGKVPPIITTLGTLSIYRGLVVVISHGEWVDAYRIPRSFVQITRHQLVGVPMLLVIALAVALLSFMFLRYTRTGRSIFAVGSNPEAATFAGIPVERIKFIVLALSGALAGLCGVLWASRYASVVNDSGTGFEFTTITACVIGGVNIFGGSGTVLGVVLGALFLGVVVNALMISRISPFWQLTVQGLVMLLAVIFDLEINRRMARFA